MNLAFAHPAYLWSLLSVPAVIFLHFMTLRSRKKLALQFANFDAIARVKGIDLYSRNLTTLFLTIAILLLAIISLSGPIILYEASASTLSFVLAIDISQSMTAADVVPSRVSVARTTASDFVREMPPATRFGVLTFSGNSFILKRVTDRKEDVLEALSSVEASSLGGTDFNEAIITATNMLVQEPSRAVILLSDGQSNVGNLEEALTYAVENNVNIYTVGIGTLAGGETSFGLSKLDEDSLKAIAYNTGGTYAHAVTSGELAAVFDKISLIKTATVAKDIAPYLLMALLFLVILEYVTISTRYRMFP